MIVQEKYLDSNKSLVKEFLKSEENILKILSPMGTGKTNIIRSFLEEENPRILFITNRVSLGLEFKERFEKYNIKFYLDRDYKVGDITLGVYHEYADIVEHIEFLLYWWEQEQEYNK